MKNKVKLFWNGNMEAMEYEINAFMEREGIVPINLSINESGEKGSIYLIAALLYETDEREKDKETTIGKEVFISSHLAKQIKSNTSFFFDGRIFPTYGAYKEYFDTEPIKIKITFEKEK